MTLHVDVSGRGTLIRACVFVALLCATFVRVSPDSFTWHNMYELVNQGKITGPEPYKSYGPYVRSFDWYGNPKLPSDIEYMKAHAPRDSDEVLFMAAEFGVNVNAIWYRPQDFVCVNPVALEICEGTTQQCGNKSFDKRVVESTRPSCIKVGCVDLWQVPHSRIFQKKEACAFFVYFEEHSYHGPVGPTTRRVSSLYA